MKKNWKKYFPSKVNYEYDNGYFFFDIRTRNILLDVKQRSCPEELLEGIKCALNGKWFDELEDSMKVKNSYKHNKKVFIDYKGRTYTIEFGVSYYLQFVCPERFDKYEAEEYEKDFVNDFVDRLETFIEEVL